MAQHYNLYTVFLEDRQRNPMPEHRKQQVRQAVEQYYRSLKPPGAAGDGSGEKINPRRLLQ